MQWPNVCFIPLVSGSYLANLTSTMRRIDSIGQDMKKILIGDLPTTDPGTHRHHMSPSVVSFQPAKKQKSLNTIFYFYCPGNSTHSHKLLLTAAGRVNRPMAEVCGKRLVRLAYHEGSLLKSQKKMGDIFSQADILFTFFKRYNLSPLFYDLNNTWSEFKEGNWTDGIIARVNKKFFSLVA